MGLYIGSLCAGLAQILKDYREDVISIQNEANKEAETPTLQQLQLKLEQVGIIT